MLRIVGVRDSVGYTDLSVLRLAATLVQAVLGAETVVVLVHETIISAPETTLSAPETMGLVA